MISETTGAEHKVGYDYDQWTCLRDSGC